jgi:hypothetical protein
MAIAQGAAAKPIAGTDNAIVIDKKIIGFKNIG